MTDGNLRMSLPGCHGVGNGEEVGCAKVDVKDRMAAILKEQYLV